ncbi:MAG: diguanylate cyclase [Candidatus Hydrogenedentes bacterium]|nr:diguanylate cyclase [Candidatus Hydrogenedentota bacterium]
MVERFRVLVAEDDPVSRKLLTRMLTSSGYEVTTACDGQEAWDLLQKNEIQLVVCDWMMPRMSGIELCSNTRSSRFSRYVYTVLVTSRDNKEDMIAGLTQGADDYITKPVERGELVARLRVGERMIRLEQALKREKEEARRQATRDVLTGLYNRRYFEEFVELEVVRSKRYGREIAFVMIDVDNFKAVNDVAGHAAGDSVLMAVAALLEKGVRGNDVVVRYGGDEFLVLLPETSDEGARIVVARLRGITHEGLADEQRRLITAGFSGKLDISCGIAIWSPNRDETVQQVLARADAAMYSDKNRKRDKGNAR